MLNRSLTNELKKRTELIVKPQHPSKSSIVWYLSTSDKMSTLSLPD